MSVPQVSGRMKGFAPGEDVWCKLSFVLSNEVHIHSWAAKFNVYVMLVHDRRRHSAAATSGKCKAYGEIGPYNSRSVGRY